MTEIETIKETPERLPKETPKELKIQKFYNSFGLIHNIFLGIIIIVFLLFIILLLTYNVVLAVQVYSITSLVNRFGGFIFGGGMTPLLSIGFSTSILFIFIGVALYVLYFLKRTDKNKKIYGKKFILRGIIGLILTFIIGFVISIILNLFTLEVTDTEPWYDPNEFSN